MLKIAKYAIINNVILGFSFVVSNLIYSYFGNMPSHQTLWNPLWLTFYNVGPAADDTGAREPNFSFYFFWVLLIVNLYFIIKLSSESKIQIQTNS
jgi:hypothetical protein